MFYTEFSLRRDGTIVGDDGRSLGFFDISSNLLYIEGVGGAKRVSGLEHAMDIIADHEFPVIGE